MQHKHHGNGEKERDGQPHQIEVAPVAAKCPQLANMLIFRVGIESSKKFLRLFGFVIPFENRRFFLNLAARILNFQMFGFEGAVNRHAYRLA